jgi:OmpA-OmpF porin, OOP family
MRKKILFFSCMLLATGAFAQDEKKPSSLGFSIGFSDFIAVQDIKNTSLSDAQIGGFSKMNTSFMVQYWKGLTKNLDVSVAYSGSFLNRLPSSFPSSATYLQSLGAALNLKMFKEKAPLNPFLTAGLEGYNFKSTWGAQAPLGMGLQLSPFKNNISFLTQAQYKLSFSDENVNHLFYSFGVLAPLTEPKAKAVVAPPPPPPPADTDMDGVIDADDKCPTVVGLAKYNGCPIPDTDKDGINDEQDKCPTVAGLAKYNGCPIPDTDKDGVNDEEDKCPTVAGVPRYNGCPIPDTDGDGVNDEEDKCPNRVGPADNFGCPVIGIKSYEIVFKTGSAVLLPKGKSTLDSVANYLNTNNTVNVSVSGYTDNTGTDKINLPLSKKRADATKAYLVSKGIAADRMTTAGYGAADPIADNKTAKGRSMNRRIEIKIQ